MNFRLTFSIPMLLLLLLPACDREPTNPLEDRGGIGWIVISISEPVKHLFFESEADSVVSHPIKGKTKRQPNLSNSSTLEVDSLFIKVYNQLTTTVPLVEKAFKAVNKRFQGSIKITAQNNLKVVCVGKRQENVIRCGIDRDVDVVAGQETDAVPEGWEESYIPQITNISYDSSRLGTYTIEWNPVRNADSYFLQEAINQGFRPYEQIDLGNRTQYQFSNKAIGTYYYRLGAANVYNVISDWSDIVSVNVTHPYPLPPTPLLSDPGLFITPDSSFFLRWNKVANVDSFQIVETTDTLSLSDRKEYYVSGANEIELSYPNTSQATLYFYRIRACIADTCSNWSGWVDMIINLPLPKPIITGPEYICSDLPFTINWNEIPTAEIYYLESTTDTLAETTVKDSTKGLSFTFSLRDSVTTDHFYRIKACNYVTCNCSEQSDWLQITVYPNPSTPEFTTSDTTFTGEIYVITWTIVSGADKYLIKCSTDSLFPENSIVEQTWLAYAAIFKNDAKSPKILYFRVKALSEHCVDSDWSKILTVILLPPS